MPAIDWSPPLTRLRAAIENARRPGVAIHARRAAEDTFPLGASRIGGRPDLAVEATWPETHALPLAFIAQIDLADIAPHSNELPASGLLSFFVLDELRIDHAVGMGSIPRRECARVIHTAAGTPLRRLDVPLSMPPRHTVAPSRATFTSVETWPQIEGTLIGGRGHGGLEMSATEWNAWAERAPDNPASQLLGHPCGCEFPRRRSEGPASSLARYAERLRLARVRRSLPPSRTRLRRRLAAVMGRSSPSRSTRSRGLRRFEGDLPRRLVAPMTEWGAEMFENEARSSRAA